MADANDDVQSESTEITPEDFAGEQDSKQADPKAESSPAKEAESKDKAEKPEAKDKSKEAEKPATEDKSPEDKESVAEVETDKPADAEDADKSEDKPTKADERKQQLNTEIRDLVSTRNALKTEVEKINSETYGVATEDELSDQVNPETGENFTKLEAKLESMRQTQEMDKYNSQVADARLTLSSESERVLQDFPIFNAESDSYDKELAEEAAGLLQANLIIDPNTEQVIGSNVSPYQLYKTLAKASGISAVKGQLKGQQATEKQLANADTASSAAPPQKLKDPLTELWSTEL